MDIIKKLSENKQIRQCLIIMLVCLLLILLVFCFNVSKYNYVYSLKYDNTYEINGIIFEQRTLRIPSSYKGKKVTSIDFLFKSTYIEKIIVSKNINTICPLLTLENLQSIIVFEENPNYKSIDGILCNKDGTILLQYPIGRKNYIIPDNVKIIGPSAFNYYLTLLEISIPKNVTEIQNFAFFDCANLTDIKLPISLQKIGILAFNNCSKLDNIVIYENILSIDKMAFYDCINLRDLTIKAATPPLLGENVFTNTHDDLVIYVPKVSLEDYLNANGWRDYSNRIQAISEE